MDRRSWLWRRKSSEKIPGETESSGSASSQSERCSDDQDVSKTSPDDAQSPEVSSHVESCVDDDTVKILTDKLSAALRKVRAKDDLVKQHAKVAEEAISGWEKADKEAASLKQQLETALQNNSTLEDKINHLDGALKECVRELRQSREDQEQRLLDAVVEKSHEWESEKNDLKNRIIELEAQLEAAKEVSASFSHDFQMKLDAVEKENEYLRSELLAQSEELNIRTLERELSTQAAETASKQHLESIKKVTKLESECLRLRAMACKKSSNDLKPIITTVSVESLTDSQSDNGERLLGLENEPSCSDSWASALIAELDHFKAAGRNPSVPSPEIDLMDDFVQMEKLAALSEAACDHPSTEPRVEAPIVDCVSDSLKAELEALRLKSSQFEEKIQTLETEKVDVEILLSETQDRLEDACKQLEDAEEKLADLQKELRLTNDSRRVAETAVDSAETGRKLLETQLETARSEVQALREKIERLERKIEEERVLSAELAWKCQNLEDELFRRSQEAELLRATLLNGELKIKQDKELAVAAGKLAECQKTIASLGQQLRSLVNLEDESTELNGGSPVPHYPGTSGSFLSNSLESANGTNLLNGREEIQSPSSSSSSSVSKQGQHPHGHLS
ncbi:unnamed protein product [Spirodela intermedia]|uniref:Uncharacterized protein n=1 Tax=Spirodela intermedia TaxID=51605 RepID=A0A7I8JDT2_SPIIN|nr:unnamed protein product [Spirodela intermedia]CAA6667683.1 unnamed protein product [Spirodela intermedia]